MSAPHVAELLRLLAQARTLAHELDVTTTKQAVAGPSQGSTGGTTAHRPLPYHVGASAARDELIAALQAFTLGTGTNTRDVPELVRTAARVAHRQSPEILYARVLRLRKALAAGWQEIDRHPERRRIGRCPCGADVLAADQQHTVRCRNCGAEHDADEQRMRLIAAARGIEVTVGEAVDAFKAIGVRVTRGQVEGWVRRGLVKPVARTLVARYGMGDLMAAYERATGRALPGTHAAGRAGYPVQQ